MLDVNITIGESNPSLISDILLEFHQLGPTNSNHLETLAYFKKFQPEYFKGLEHKLMFLMGLFYKSSEPTNFIEQIYQIYSESIIVDTGHNFTPVQADAYKSIIRYDNFSFSAPTSAGKSYLFQEIIKDIDGDIVIIVPSRALLSEYIIKVKKIVPNDVLVLAFIEFVNTKKTKRSIYIITPERGDDLFKHITKLNVKLFLFDEAQLSEEGIRGMRFDSFVRRVDKKFPNTKKVFTHPFVVNPEAQLIKHSLTKNSDSESYTQKTVGKIFLEHDKRKFRYFSPYEDNSNNEFFFDGDIIEETLTRNKTALIYISKSKIYKTTFLESYSRYLKLCEDITDKKALGYIEELESYLGANKEKISLMLLLMRKGVVIHHGSMPLKARLIIEKFVNENYAKLCFSTSTLIQGINMPFDLVWINNFSFSGNENQKRLNLKNLIGRAGRTTSTPNSYDYGYVIVEKKNLVTFKLRINEESHISEESLLDSNIENLDEDYIDIVTAIKDDAFNNELNLTNNQVERINNANINKEIKYILDNLLDQNDDPLTGAEYYNLGNYTRTKIKRSFEKIYSVHLRRQDLTRGEKKVLSTSIPILLWQIQGKSFSEIVSLRYSFLSQRDLRRKLRTKLKKNEISFEDYNSELENTKVRFTCVAEMLPNKNFKVGAHRFPNTSIVDIDFDILIYDTYDYIDKVISLSLKDPLSAAFLLYYENKHDERAKSLSNYIKYGTNDITEIWLLKYGFTFDEIEWILPHIDMIDETEIVFKNSINEVIEDTTKLEIIERYL